MLKLFFAGACTVRAALTQAIASTLISFVFIFLLFSVACYLSGHDMLVMLHMYWSPFFLSLAFGGVALLDFADASPSRDEQHVKGHRSLGAAAAARPKPSRTGQIRAIIALGNRRARFGLTAGMSFP